MKIVRYFIFLSAFSLLATLANAQVFPVTAHVQINPPSTTYLPEFSALGSDRLSVNLFLNDFNEPIYDVRLRVSIEGNGITLVTHPNYAPPMTTLSPGANLFSGSDLANYLNPNNMLVSGISKQALQQGGSGLPEGIYNFCVQVFDYRRPNVALSLNHCTASLLRKNYPPTLVAPACGSTIPVLGGSQDILFQWHANADFSIPTLYELSLVEVPPGMNPDDAMNGTATKILDSEPVMGTSFLYGPEQLPLEPTKKYAWRVKALDVEDMTTFENNGLSPVCTFYYGVAGNGMVPLVSPLLDQRVSTVQQLTMRWGRPANAIPGQQVYYKLKMVLMLEGQSPEVALDFNPVWYEVETPVIPGNAALVLPDSLYPLPPERHYAWEVKAYSDNSGTEEEIAVSEKRFFKSAPAVERFKAGNPDWNMITVTTLTKNEDLTSNQKKISGIGTMKIRANGEEVTLHFTDITVGPLDDFWQLVAGTIIEPLTNFKVHLDNNGNPAGDTTNLDNYGRADFVATHVIVEKDDLKLRGKVHWAFPHATTGGTPVVHSVENEVLYNRYQLIENDISIEAAAFNLLEPYGFKIDYFASTNSASKFSLYQNILTLHLDGGMTTSNKVKNMAGQQITYHFQGVQSPFYFTSNTVEVDEDFKVANGTTMQINPRAIIFDLSEDQSPVGIATPQWKGMYFNDFVLRLPVGFDGSGQMITANEIQAEFTEISDASTRCFADKDGLTLNLFYNWNMDADPARIPVVLNTFSSTLSYVLLSIDKNIVDESSQLSGYFGLPLLSEGDFFVFNMDITNSGIQLAYLHEELGVEGFIFTMNENEYMRALAIEVKQARLVAPDHLEMTIDLDWPALDIALENIPHFKLWGDGRMGFNTPNGTHHLATQVNGYLPGNQTFTYTVDQVGCITSGNDMAVDVEGNTAVAENVSGPAGAPRMKIGSAKLAGDKLGTPDDTGTDVGLPLGLAGIGMDPFWGDGNFSTQLKANLGPTMGFNAVVRFQPNDPLWGDVWHALFDGDFGIPGVTATTYQALFQFICGKKTKNLWPPLAPNEDPMFSYWFLELGFGALEKQTDDKILEQRRDEAIEAARQADADLRNKTAEGRSKKVKLAAMQKMGEIQAELDATDEFAEPEKYHELENQKRKVQSDLEVNKSRLDWLSKKATVASNWAGGKVEKGQDYVGKRFKDLGDSAIGQRVKKGAKAVKSKFAGLGFDKWKQGIPIGSVLLTGLQGRIYYHMSHDVTNGIVKGAVTQAAATAEQGTSDPNSYARMIIPEFPATTTFNYLPDHTTSIGIMLMANVESIDIAPAITGNKFRGYGAVEVAFNSSGGIQSFGIEASGGYVNYTVPILIDQSMLKGYMNFGYHAPESKWRASGYFMTETMALCGVGDFDLTITPSSTSIRIGSAARKLFFVTGCYGYYALGWLDYKNNATANSLDIGLGLGWQATARYKIGLVLADVTPYATVGIEAGLAAKVNFPAVSFEKFGIWVNAWARVGIYIDWPWPVPDQDLAIGLTLGGDVYIYPATEPNPWRVAGTIGGYVSIGPLGFPFSVPFNKNL